MHSQPREREQLQGGSPVRDRPEGRRRRNRLSMTAKVRVMLRAIEDVGGFPAAREAFERAAKAMENDDPKESLQ